MSIHLNPHEARVLGCLIEKRLSTPNNYPLTLNSLVNACNQTSNRDPVTDYDQHLVNDALVNTRNQGLSKRLSKSLSAASHSSIPEARKQVISSWWFRALPITCHSVVQSLSWLSRDTVVFAHDW